MTVVLTRADWRNVLPDIIEQIRARIKEGYLTPSGSAAGKPSPVTTSEAIAVDEQDLGFSLPPLLKGLYLTIGNGGWGPGYGLLGLTGGAPDDVGNTALSSYRSRRSWTYSNPSERWPEKLIPICNWGCAIYSCVDLLDADLS